MADGSVMKFCNKCGIEHEWPTGKRQSQRSQMMDLEPLEVITPEMQVDASKPVDSDTRMAKMLTIMSRFASHTVEQLSSIQAALVAPTPESGAIPKWHEVRSSTQSPAQDSNIPSMQNLRADAAAQVASMVEALDLRCTGYSQTQTFINRNKATKRG
jgi:hypothetical protein